MKTNWGDVVLFAGIVGIPYLVYLVWAMIDLIRGPFDGGKRHG